MELYLFAAGGVVFHLFTKYYDNWTKKATFDWKKQLFHSVLGVIVACLCIYWKNELAQYFAFQVNSIMAFILGYFADSVWKNIEAFGRSKIEKIGNEIVTSPTKKK